MQNSKFKIGDLVGWRSDTPFTAENKLKPAQKIVRVRKCPEAEGFEYIITNYQGWQMQHELEKRQEDEQAKK